VVYYSAVYMGKRTFQLPDCMGFDCGDACCHYGADVWPDEYNRLISSKVATEKDFSKPYRCEGDVLYRTRVRNGGCVFLQPERGCRLHATGDKPVTCQNFPRNRRVARQAYSYGYLPCFASIDNRPGR
jgi:Fe-S-cluster containining protein